MWQDNRAYTFLLEETYLWIIDNLSLYKMLVDGLYSCWLLVDYCMFLSAVWTLILTALIYCRGYTGEASDAMLNFSKPVPMNRQIQLLYILDILMVGRFSADFHFWVT